jgi:hypothetical protein
VSARRRAAALALAVVGLTALALAIWLWRRAASDPLDGRLGGPVSTFDRRYGGAGQIESGPFRRIYAVPDGRLLLDLARSERVRQLTLGRDRAVNDTRQPDPGDWPLERAKTLARPLLPADAAFVRTEPFVFRAENAGTRDVYRSVALAAVFPADVYAELGALGPPGVLAVTYYQTTAGGVAFFLVGLP